MNPFFSPDAVMDKVVVMVLGTVNSRLRVKSFGEIF